MNIEKIIKMLIEGTTTKEEVCKSFHIDHRTLDKRIQDLQISNPELYIQYISKFPTKTNKNIHIDYEALIIEFLKGSMTKKEICLKYDITPRSLSMKIIELAKKNPELIRIYRAKAQERVGRIKFSEEEEMHMDRVIHDLELSKVLISESSIVAKKEELEELRRAYYTLKTGGKTQAEIEKALGKDYSTIIREIELYEKILLEDSKQRRIKDDRGE